MSATAASKTIEHAPLALATRDDVSKLVCRTFLDGDDKRQPQTGVTVYDYGDGLIEAVACRRFETSKPSNQSPPDIPDLLRQQDNERRATARARTTVRRLVMFGNLTHLLTLTTRACIPDPERFWSLWERYVRLIREHLPNWQYVTVPEPQTRGAVHLHAAVRGFQDVRLLRRLWLRVLHEQGIEGGGSVNVCPPRNARRPKIARYLSKYIGKAFGGTLRTDRAHRYRGSTGLKATPTRHIIGAWRHLRDALETVFSEAGAGVGGMVELDNVGAVWGCSWDRDGDTVVTTGWGLSPPALAA
ncbi:MAG: hypothetical protein H7Z12_15610 [Rhodospirillaceae bacterium]|nr:hypothetical protein [Rhodospirillales bacterium]